MPSPFPGMDPYLENLVLWRGVHDRLIPLIAKAINDALPNGYFADINERVYISEPLRSSLPDVAVMTEPGIREPKLRVNGLKVPPVADEPLIVFIGDEVREPLVEIMAVSNQDYVITTIEVVSPANKVPGAGFDQYSATQQRTLSSGSSLLEIDLLRHGVRTSVPLADVLQSSPSFDYLVSLRRGGNSSKIEAWPFSVRDRFPRVGVPLMPHDSDVVLDLGIVFDQCYDDGAYGRRVNYEYEPIPPVSDFDGAWLDNLLRKESLRF